MANSQSDKKGEHIDHAKLESNADAVNRALQEYLADYEFRGDDGCHTPTEVERLLIEDAIQGLMVEDAFVDAFVKMHNQASAPSADLERNAVALLKRIVQWDMLDACADGPYWKREITATLNGLGQFQSAPSSARPHIDEPTAQLLAAISVACMANTRESAGTCRTPSTRGA